MTRFIRLAVLVGAAVVVAGRAAGQPLAAAPDLSAALDGVAKVGDTLRVDGTDGSTVKGTLQTVSSSSLTIVCGGSPRAFDAFGIARINRENRDSPADGALYGALAGGTVAAVLGIAAGAGGWQFSASNFVRPVLLFSGIGAAAGFAIDLGITDHKTVFDRVKNPMGDRIAVAPILAKSEKGVRLTLQW